MSSSVDVLIIGAGLSGVGVACQLASARPDLRLTIVERRHAIGGTWDLFRFPGVRSDSDMASYGYSFNPWAGHSVVADGRSIQRYIAATASRFGVERLIRFGLRVTKCDWSSVARRWSVTVVDEQSGQTEAISCRFMVAATGYFDHDAGYTPDIPGTERFAGRVVHAQHWPQDLDYRGKRVAVIGSGATAVTLVPAMASEALHVTMVQRSPSYMYRVRSSDRAGQILRAVLPLRTATSVLRWRNVILQRLAYKASLRFPRLMRHAFLSYARAQLADKLEMRNFTPQYAPWEQRPCAVLDGNLFSALREGRASVVTGEINQFTTSGLRLTDGRDILADLIVFATGLRLQMLGGAALYLDGREHCASEQLTYKGVLLQNVPNFAAILGYINLSWTLKAELVGAYLCRLLDEMDRRGATIVTPRAPDGETTAECIMDALSSGYVKRSRGALPKQGRRLPWRMTHSYELDRRMLRAPLDDPALSWE